MNYNTEFWQNFYVISAAILGAWSTYFFQNKFNKNNQKELTISFLKNIETELSSVWDRYYETIGNKIENLLDHSGFDSYYPIFDKYFIVYDNNSNLLANVPEDLSKQIVKTYTLAKGLKDSFLFNNDLINKIIYYDDMAQETNSEHFKRQHIIFCQSWIEYGTAIKEIHLKLKEHKETTINLISKELNKK